MERVLAQHITPKLFGRTPEVAWVALSEIRGKQRRQRVSIVCRGSSNVHITSLPPNDMALSCAASIMNAASERSEPAASEIEAATASTPR
jgi:hypothetical protein